MKKRAVRSCVFLLLVLTAVPGVLPESVHAAPPVVKTVPWVPTNPLIPHDTWSGKTITLKGTTDLQGANIQWTWDFGDGSPTVSGTVANPYILQATHAYAGPVGTVYTARLTVQDMNTGEMGSKPYYVEIRARSLAVEVNVAIDEGLWYLHRTQYRYVSGGLDYGNWTSGGFASLAYYGVTAANINAFETNGHLESGNPDNPYTETVRRGMRQLFLWLYASPISTQSNGLGFLNPDSNGNGLGVYVNQSYPFYQGGMFIDAIVASGTPNAVVAAGPSNIVGRTYKDIVQDMVDAYAYCQYDGSPGGGWRYNCNEFPDNSSCQWGAIGLIAAERVWGVTVPSAVKGWNVQWLIYTQDPGTGAFGYTSPGYYPWGPYATTPSGMVQLALDGIGRGSAGAPSWDKAETLMRNSFANPGGPANSIKDYYYGLFSFVKSLLLHDSNNDGIPEPITLLQSSTPGVNPIDWYAAEYDSSQPASLNNTDGVARTLVNDQNAGGYWWGHNYDSNQYFFETAWAIIMLNRTVFTGGAPVAVAAATPNPALAGQNILLDGGGSFHQDPGRSIVGWEWDFNNDGMFDATGPQVSAVFASLGNYPVRLRVTDNGTPPVTAETILTVQVTIPPTAPTANAGGPYNFCTNRQPWFFDGSKSVNPDDGQSQPGAPGDFLKEHAWDLNGDAVFGDATGPRPDVTAFFTALGPGSYLIQLRVTDNTALSFPASGLGDLSDVASTQVTIRSGSDPACGCISNLTAYPKNSLVQLTWSPYAGTDHYNVYRGTISGGPYLFIGTAASTDTVYFDRTVVNGTTYYYVLRPAALNGTENCQSNQVVARPRSLR